MRTALQFRSRLDFGGEILTQQVTFLPTSTGRRNTEVELCAPEVHHLAGFLPAFNFKGKNSTVAQPLLNENMR